MNVSLTITYILTIFIYIFIRIKRDGMIVAYIGQEGTSISKVISLGVGILLVFFLRYISNKISIKNLWIITMIIFLLFFIVLECQLLPIFSIDNSSNLLYKLLCNVPIISLYVMSELFAITIASQFWKVANRNNISPFQIFMSGQFGLLSAALLLFLNAKITFYPVIIAFLIIILLAKNFHFQNNSTKKTLSPENHEKKSLQSGFIFWAIPMTTLFCGACAGFLDANCKYKMANYCTKSSYQSMLASIWIIQSLLTIVFNLYVKNIRIFWITAMYILCFSIISIGFTGGFLIAILIVQVLGFKILKYSSHSPLKELYLKNANIISEESMDEILAWDGLFSRIGKNGAAIILASIFLYGYSWSDITNYIPIVAIFFSSIWLFIAYKFSKITHNKI